MKNLLLSLITVFLFQGIGFAQGAKSSAVLKSKSALRLSTMLGNQQVSCHPEKNTKETDHLHFSFQLSKQGTDQVLVEVTTKSEEDPIWYGGEGIIDISVGSEFTTLALGDDGRRFIAFTTPGKDFEFWGNESKGTCTTALISAVWSGNFLPGEVAECCVNPSN